MNSDEYINLLNGADLYTFADSHIHMRDVFLLAKLRQKLELIFVSAVKGVNY